MHDFLLANPSFWMKYSGFAYYKEDIMNVPVDN
jgi:hypothetical protein